MPLLPALMSVVTPLTTSRRKIWLVPDGLFVTKLLAVLSNSANRPLVEMALGQESPLPPSVPARSMLTRIVFPLVRSCKKTFMCGVNRVGMGIPLLLMARLLARLANKIYLPSALMTGAKESPLPPAGGAKIPLATLTGWTAAWVGGQNRATQSRRNATYFMPAPESI